MHLQTRASSNSFNVKQVKQQVWCTHWKTTSQKHRFFLTMNIIFWRKFLTHHVNRTSTLVNSNIFFCSYSKNYSHITLTTQENKYITTSGILQKKKEDRTIDHLKSNQTHTITLILKKQQIQFSWHFYILMLKTPSQYTHWSHKKMVKHVFKPSKPNSMHSSSKKTKKHWHKMTTEIIRPSITKQANNMHCIVIFSSWSVPRRKDRSQLSVPGSLLQVRGWQHFIVLGDPGQHILLSLHD